MSESTIQKTILQYLGYHTRVAWAQRINTGAFKVDRRFIKCGFKGCSDIIGQMVDGRFLAIEVKAPKKYPSKEQRQFLATVNEAGGAAGVARSVEDVEKILHEL